MDEAPQHQSKRPVGRPRKIEDIDELHRQGQLKQVKFADRIRRFAEQRLDALEKAIENGAVSKIEFESFKVAVQANVEGQKITDKVMVNKPLDDNDRKKVFDLEAFLREQQQG